MKLPASRRCSADTTTPASRAAPTYIAKGTVSSAEGLATGAIARQSSPSGCIRIGPRLIRIERESLLAFASPVGNY
jgi:hypothetical protein